MIESKIELNFYILVLYQMNCWQCGTGTGQIHLDSDKMKYILRMKWQK